MHAEGGRKFLHGQPTEWNPFVRVDISQIEVKGTPGDVVALRGGSW